MVVPDGLEPVLVEASVRAAEPVEVDEGREVAARGQVEGRGERGGRRVEGCRLRGGLAAGRAESDLGRGRGRFRGFCAGGGFGEGVGARVGGLVAEDYGGELGGCMLGAREARDSLETAARVACGHLM